VLAMLRLMTYEPVSNHPGSTYRFSADTREIRKEPTEYQWREKAARQDFVRHHRSVSFKEVRTGPEFHHLIKLQCID
jgi:hypothetical protein